MVKNHAQENLGRAIRVGAHNYTPLLVLVALILAIAPAVFAAAPQSGANFEPEWSKLIAAAKHEGTLSGRFRRRAVAPVSSGGRCLQQEIRRQSRSLHRQRHRHGQSRLAERKAGKYTVDVALISSRENQQRLVPSESLVPIRVRCCIHPEVIDIRIGTAGATCTPKRFSKFTFDLPCRFRGPVRDLVQHRENQRSGDRYSQQTDRHFRSAMERQDRRPRHGRPVRHSPDDRQLFRAGPRPRMGAEIHAQRRRDLSAMTAAFSKPGSSMGDFRCNLSPPAPRSMSRARAQKGLPIKRSSCPRKPA